MYQATSKREVFIFCSNQLTLQLDMNGLSYTFCQGPSFLATTQKVGKKVSALIKKLKFPAYPIEPNQYKLNCHAPMGLAMTCYAYSLYWLDPPSGSRPIS